MRVVGLIKYAWPCWSFGTQRPSAFYKCSFVHVHPHHPLAILFNAIEEKLVQLLNNFRLVHEVNQCEKYI